MNRLRPHSLGWIVGLLATVLSSAVPAEAHDFSITQAVVLFKADGTYLIDLCVDVDSLAMGIPPTHPLKGISKLLREMPPEAFEAAVQRARDTLMEKVHIQFDGQPLTPTVDFPARTADAASGNDSTVLGTTARLSGRVPQEAATFTFSASSKFKTVQLTILDEVTASGMKHMLAPGEAAPPYQLHAPQIDDRAVVFARYVVLGFRHIIPNGVDHMLFVFGLFLLSTHLRPLLWQITAFTVAHSVTLALSMTNVASLPSRLVESLIALSIAYVAVENLFVREMKPWRPAVVFAFGLLHGMGFAGVLRELGMPAGRFASALVSFNVGVEFGQLSVIILACSTVGWFRNRGWYRNVIIRPLSLAIAGIGAYWAVQRALGGG